MKNLILLFITINISTFIYSQKKDGEIKEYHSNGQLKSIVTYKNGVKDGLDIRYYKNGEINNEMTWSKGKIIGIWNQFYENGNKQYKAYYINGKAQGVFTKWYANGIVKYRIEYKNGKQWNILERNDMYGNALQIGTFKNGNGTTFLYDKKDYFGTKGEGILYGVFTFKNGEIIHENYDLKNIKGKEIEKNKSNNSNMVKEYYDTGELLRKGVYGENNFAIGNWTFYFKNGNKKMEGSFSKNGDLKKTGKWKYYHENGKLREVCKYVNNIRTGKWSAYNNKGEKYFDVEELKLKSSKYNDKKIPVGVWKYVYESGEIAKEITYDGTLTFREAIPTKKKYYNKKGQEIKNDPSSVRHYQTNYISIGSSFLIPEIEVGKEIFNMNILDTYPQFHNCENSNNVELKKCFNQYFLKILNDILEIYQGRRIGRIFIQLYVNKNGKIQVKNIRSQTPSNMQKVINYKFSNFKSIKPALVNGEKVDAFFMFPLRIN